jgi:hypothetical protein
MFHQVLFVVGPLLVFIVVDVSSLAPKDRSLRFSRNQKFENSKIIFNFCANM